MVVDEAFDKLFLNEFDHTVRIVKKLVFFKELAEDISAEAFAKAVRDWKKVKEHESPEKWITRVAINLALDLIRKNSKSKHLLDQYPVSISSENDFESQMQIYSALDRLSKQQNKIMTLKYFLDYSETEISEVLKLHIGTVKTHTKRALENLKTDTILSTYFDKELVGVNNGQ